MREARPQSLLSGLTQLKRFDSVIGWLSATCALVRLLVAETRPFGYVVFCCGC
jgi:hypothetical protein